MHPEGRIVLQMDKDWVTDGSIKWQFWFLGFPICAGDGQGRARGKGRGRIWDLGIWGGGRLGRG